MLKNLSWLPWLLPVLNGLGQAHVLPAESSAADSAADVAAAAEKLRLLMIAPDRAQLEALVAEGLSYGHSAGKLDTRTSFVDGLVKVESDFVDIDITDQTVSVSGTAAVVRHTLKAGTNDGGKPGHVHLHILQVWQLQQGAWKLLARQAIRVPV